MTTALSPGHSLGFGDGQLRTEQLTPANTDGGGGEPQ